MSGSRYRRRSQSSALDDLYRVFVAAPAWAPIPVAAVLGAAVAFGIPALLHVDRAAGTWHELGLLVGLGVLLIGGAALVEKGRRGRMLARSRSLDDLRRLPWQDFEALVAEAYRRQGWAVSEVGAGLGPGADGGVDLILRRDREVVAVQCKKWIVDLVGVEKVRELQGALPDHGATRGIFVSVGEFTPEAAAYAARRGMELLNGEALLGMLPVGTAMAAEVDRGAEVTCPRCGSLMARRQGRHGPFWGCRHYPACRGTRPLIG